MTKPCFLCGEPIEDIGGSRAFQAYKGLSFQTTGAYGSQLWDSIDGLDVLEIHIHDQCVKSRWARCDKWRRARGLGR